MVTMPGFLSGKGALDRLHRLIELAEPQIGQSEVRPRRRFVRDAHGGAGELLAGIVEETDFKRREAVIERARGLLVSLRAGFGKA